MCILSQVDEELEIKAYYAGHVLGAAMVLIKVGSESVVYTVSITLSVTSYVPVLFEFVVINLNLCVQGDYNMTPDRHLG